VRLFAQSEHFKLCTSEVINALETAGLVTDMWCERVRFARAWRP
jgi:hypothetical protein